MTKLDNTQFGDLCDLAAERVAEAFGSVDQLVEDNYQKYMMQVAVISSMCEAAAMHLHEGVVDNPPLELCYERLFTALVKCARAAHKGRMRIAP